MQIKLPPNRRSALSYDTFMTEESLPSAPLTFAHGTGRSAKRIKQSRPWQDLDRNLEKVIDFWHLLLRLALTMLAIVAVSAIVHRIWFVTFGHRAFHLDRDVFPIVGAIVYLAIAIKYR